MQNRTEFIYTLNDHNNHIFYCGRTSDLDRRLKEHIDESLTGGSSKKCRHIRELLEAGHQITINKIDEAPATEIAELEAWWINQLDFNVGDFDYTVVLFNGNAGSQGNVIDEIEVRDSIQQWKKASKKPKKVYEPTGGPCDPAEFDALMRLYETDRTRFELAFAAHRELQAEKAKHLTC